MKIMYAYKHFEININRLLKAAFSLDQPKGFYNWDALTGFLKNRNIIASEVAHHQDLKELQAVNNAIKHSDTVDKTIKSIREFTSQDYLSSERLLAFYKRIKDVPTGFLEDLSDKIYQELYDFNERKLHCMATDLALRMDRDTALHLITLLRGKYS